jgi:hypothetical protein
MDDYTFGAASENGADRGFIPAAKRCVRTTPNKKEKV